MARASAGSLVARRFRLSELLGRGSMGEVWRSVDERTGETIAVKLLRGELSEGTVTAIVGSGAFVVATPPGVDGGRTDGGGSTACAAGVRARPSS